MGMLNFSLGVSLSILALVALDRHRAGPVAAGAGLVAAGLLLITWYAHPVPVLVVGLLARPSGLAAPTSPDRAGGGARAILLPLAPVGIAVAISTLVHLRGTVRPPGAGDATTFQTLPWLVYDLWAHWAYGYTLLSVTSLALLGGARCLRVRSPPGAGALLRAARRAEASRALYFAAPYETVGIGYAGSRIVPYLWLAALLRVPERVGVALGSALAACSALYAAGMAVDTVRLAREQDEFAAGTSAVKPGSRLDVLNFSPRVTSVNTWSLPTHGAST